MSNELNLNTIKVVVYVHCYGGLGPDQLAVGNVMNIITLKAYSSVKHAGLCL